MAARRISALASAVVGEPQPACKTPDDDVVIVQALRTPITKARRGNLKDTTPDKLLATAIKAVLEDTGFPPERLGDICVGV